MPSEEFQAKVRNAFASVSAREYLPTYLERLQDVWDTTDDQRRSHTTLLLLMIVIWGALDLGAVSGTIQVLGTNIDSGFVSIVLPPAIGWLYYDVVNLTKMSNALESVHDCIMLEFYDSIIQYDMEMLMTPPYAASPNLLRVAPAGRWRWRRQVAWLNSLLTGNLASNALGVFSGIVVYSAFERAPVGLEMAAAVLAAILVGLGLVNELLARRF